MFRLLRYFAFSSLILIVIAALALAVFSRHILDQTLIEQGQGQNLAVGLTIDSQLQEHTGLLNLAASEQRTNIALWFDHDLLIRSERSVSGLALFDTAGTRLYRSELFEIADRLIPQQLQALARGQALSELKPSEVSGAVSQQVVTLIPLDEKGWVGDFTLAVSSDVTPLFNRIERNRYLLGTASGLVMLLLYGLLYFVVRYADGELAKQHAKLQQLLAEQKQIKQGLEQRVVERTQGLNSEIDERRQIEQSLREKEAYLQAVMANIFNGIICIDKRGLILSFNPTAERMFGYRQDQVTGNNVSLLMPADHASKHDSYIDNYLTTGRAGIIGSLRALSGVRKDGTEFPIELAITETRVADEPIFIGTIRDISDQVEAEKAFFEARQKYYHQEKMAAIGFLSAGLVHEIGNPISAISGLLDGICDPGTEELPCNAKANVQLRMVQEQVDRIINITRDVSEFAMPQAQGPELQDLNNLIGRTSRLMRHDRRFTEVELKLTLDNQIPAIYAVGDHLIQVLMNLLVNAVDAISECPDRAGLIELNSGVEAERVWFEVFDNGCGMNQEVLSRASDAFYTTKKVGQGSGLGLSLSQSLVNEQGGTMTISSQINRGTRVRVTLPAQPTTENNELFNTGSVS
ncbi:MAG: PAS domain S-box protein [Halopseudomonas sp.]